MHLCLMVDEVIIYVVVYILSPGSLVVVSLNKLPYLGLT
jgi:hypothetical protein